MTETPSPDLPLTPGAQLLVDEFTARKEPRVGDWLDALLARYGAMVEALVPGMDRKALKAGGKGEAGATFAAPAVLEQARVLAQSLGKSKVAERDLAAVVLRAAGFQVTLTPASTGSEEPRTAPAQPGPNVAGPEAAGGIRVFKPTPTLDRFGKDLTRAAREGKLPAVIGRAAEIETVIETLCRRTKRNPLLVGPAGTGKTAIVEGLAQRIVREDVPPQLRGVRLISLQPSALVAGAGIVGELDKRMGEILAEANQEGVLLFIDEVHAIMGAGGREGTGDLASMIKPALARGDIACISATTDDEYRRFIENDRALERRFQAIRVEELTPAQTIEVLKAVRDDVATKRGIAVGDDLLAWLVDIAKRFMPNRRFPDKAVDLLDQTVAYGVTRQLDKITQTDAEQVVRRMLGMPSLERTKLESLRETLVGRGLLTGGDTDRLMQRLEVTSRGLDMRPARPNAVILLTGGLVALADTIAAAIAEGVYGSPDRIVRVDFGRLQDESDSNVLLGSPPGYVGYADRHAFDALTETPWSVVLCERVDLCHPAVLAAFTPALLAGTVTDMRGRRIYFSDAVIILTVSRPEEGRRTIGFGAHAGQAANRDDPPEDLLGPELVDTIDFVFSDEAVDAAEGSEWITSRLLPDIAARHRERGVLLEWDPSVVKWLEAEWTASHDARAVERLVENQIGSALVREVYRGSESAPGRCLIKWQSANVVVQRIP